MAVRTSFTAGEVLAAADLTDTFGAKANLASPTFTGTPAAPTAAAGTNTTQLATTAFVQSAGGLVLVSPTSIANSGGSASASGGAVSFTGVSSVSLNGVFTSAYSAYRILVRITTATSDGLLVYRLRSSGTDNSINYYSGLGGSDQNGSYANSTISGTNISYAYIAALDSGTNYATGSIDLESPQLATKTGANIVSTWFTSGSVFCGSGGGNVHDNNGQFDGISIIATAGNITGTIRIYGYKNS